MDKAGWVNSMLKQGHGGTGMSLIDTGHAATLHLEARYHGTQI